MTTHPPNGDRRDSSPGLIHSSDDDIFNSDHADHETVTTLSLAAARQNGESQVERETVATLPLSHAHGPVNTPKPQDLLHITQPTQVIPRDQRTTTSSSSPSRPTVQVEASSPIPTPAPIRKPSGILASAVMAPAGTYVRRPVAFPQQPSRPIIIPDDDEGPKYRGGSSDDEITDVNKNDIKVTNFKRSKPQPDTVPESPAKGNSLFKSITSNSFYGAAANGVKRPAEQMRPQSFREPKRPRQTGPSRAMPVKKQEPDMDIDDIQDYNTRRKVKQMIEMLRNAGLSVRQCYFALLDHKGSYDDAVDHLLLQSDRKQRQSVDLTGSDDELAMTPAGPQKYLQPPPKQQVAKQTAKAPVKSIAEKYSSTQHFPKLAPKPSSSSHPLDVFEEPPKKGKRLVRGRKETSSPLAEESEVQSPIGRKQVILSDESDADDDSGIHLTKSDVSFEGRLLKWFNECTAADLADTANIKPSLAEHVLQKRPFRTLAAIDKIDNPELKPSKGRRKAVPVGTKIAEKCFEMLESYEAVDYLVKKCESLAKPLTDEMKKWGINVAGSNLGELDMVSLHDSKRAAHDSGIGTPVSEDEVRGSTPKSFLPQPTLMNAEYQMKDYQIVGMNWLNMLYRRRLSCILADDMGLGKTYQVIAFLSHLLETGERGPHLIVVPAATLENWLKEFHRFSPQLSVEPYYATNPGERALIRDQLEASKTNVNVIVTTYHIAKAKEDAPWLRHFGFCCTVFDEGHFLKNADSQLSQKLVKIRSKFRLLLTGTPLQNNLKELISLLGFMMPDLFKEKAEELQAIFTHNVKAMDENHEALLSAQRIARARSMLTPFILRRKKYQVLKDLPKKTRRVEYCDLAPEQEEIYYSWLQKAIDLRARRERGEDCGVESSHILMKLRQAAIHPFLFRRLYRDSMLPKIAQQCLKSDQWKESNPDLIVTELKEYSDMEVHKLCSENAVLEKFALNDHEWLASGKVQKMLELLRAFMAEGHHTLIFSQFTMVLNILELVLEREAIAYFRLDGSTPVSERQDLIDEFSADDNATPVFMLSTRAGGAGINLAKANKVIVFDSGFNPQDDIQAENRAHRIGQTKEVEVVRLVTRCDVEEQIYRMGLTKLKLDEEVAGVGGAEEDEKTHEKKEEEGRKAVEAEFFRKLEDLKQEAIEVKIRKSASMGAGESQNSITKGLKKLTTDDKQDEDGAVGESRPTSQASAKVIAGDVEPAGRPKRATAKKAASTPLDSDDAESVKSGRSSRRPTRRR